MKQLLFFLGKYRKELETSGTSSQEQSQSNIAARVAAIDPNDINNEKVLADLFRDIDLYNLSDNDALLLDDLLSFEAENLRLRDNNQEVRMVLLGATGSG